MEKVEYIKREDAEKALLEQCYCTGYGGLIKADIQYVMRRIPSADVAEVRHGEWKEKLEPCGWFDEPCAECSVCGEDFVLGECDMDDLIKLFKFCPNCGADMRGGT